jgi:hypothetical protein
MSSLATLRALATRNWTLKLSALGIAFLLWFSVRFEARNEQELSSVAIRLDLTDPEWVLGNGVEPGSVSVRFRGPAVELVRLSADRPVVVVPVSDVGSSDTTVVIQPGWVRFGDRPGVTVEGISPGTIRLRLEPVQRSTLGPELRFTGELPADVAMVEEPRATVREFRVSGPRSRMAGLAGIPITPVDLSEVRQSGAIPVQVDTAQVPRVQVQPLALEVELRVEPRIERIFFLATPALPEPLAGAELSGYPDEVPVEVTGGVSLVEGLAPGSLRLVAILPDDLDPDPEAWGEVEVRFEIQGVPPFLEARVDPVRVQREEP